jgi:effector-binding domain-containing protein
MNVGHLQERRAPILNYFGPMKKWLLALVALLLIAIACIYFLIPSRLKIQQSISINVNARGFTRHLLDERKWLLWWPERSGPTTVTKDRLPLNGNVYQLTKKRVSSLLLSIQAGGDTVATELVFIPLKANLVQLNMEAELRSAPNPVARVRSYIKAQSIARDQKVILRSLQRFYSVEDNLYGFHIEKKNVSDSILISTSAPSGAPPTIESMYALIDQLKSFARGRGARETGPPMLHVSMQDSITYLTRVALPVDKILRDSGNISYRWMLPGGKILVTEVKGGPQKVERAFTEMQNYVEDYHRAMPAINFQSLVTDRRSQRDTSQWITRIYCPVM